MDIPVNWAGSLIISIRPWARCSIIIQWETGTFSYFLFYIHRSMDEPTPILFADHRPIPPISNWAKPICNMFSVSSIKKYYFQQTHFEESLRKESQMKIWDFFVGKFSEWWEDGKSNKWKCHHRKCWFWVCLAGVTVWVVCTGSR